MMRARSARLRRVVAARTHAVSGARSSAATANFVATAMPSVHHTTTRMASELTRRDTRVLKDLSMGLPWPRGLVKEGRKRLQKALAGILVRWRARRVSEK